MPGYVVSESAVPARTAEGDTASVRLAVDASVGCERLEQRIFRFVPGRSAERGVDERQEVLYVASGRGTLHLNGRTYELEPDMGVYIAAGEHYSE